MAVGTLAVATGVEVYRDGKHMLKSVVCLKDMKSNHEKLMLEARGLKAIKDAI